MIVIPPLTITDSILYSSTVTETDSNDLGASAWSSGSGYSVGAYVYRPTTHKIYQCVSTVTAASAASLALPEVNVYATVPNWTEVRPTNKFAMFDLLRNTRTVATSTITVVLKPVQRVDAIAILDLVNVSHVYINVSYNAGASNVTLIDADITTDNVVKINVPPYYNTTITITLTGTGTIECGVCAVGIAENIGILQRGAGSDFTSFSRVDRDTYGNASMVQKRSIPTIRVTTFLDAKQVNRVAALRDSVNALPVIWCGLDDQTTADYYDTLLIVGFYKGFSIALDNHLAATVSLELEEI